MRFIGESEPLGRAAAFAARHTGGALPAPVLAGLRVTAAADGRVELAGYDYEASTTVSLPLAVAEAGEVLLPGRVFADILRSLPAGPVEVRTAGSTVEVIAEGIDFGLPTLPLGEYPTLPEAPPTIGTVDAEAFGRAAGRLAKVALREDTLPILSGTLLEFGADRLTLAATDRYRIALAELPWQPADSELPGRTAGGGGSRRQARTGVRGSPPANGTGQAVVPARLLAETVKGLDSKAGLAIGLRTGGEELFGLADEQRSTTMRVLDGTYPALRSKLPDTFLGTLTVDAEELRAALRRVCLVADHYAAVVLTIGPDELVVAAAGELETRGRQRLACQLDGAGTTTAFNAGYLLDGLEALDTANARLGFDEGIRPALLTGDEAEPAFRYVVLPRRPPA